MPRGQGWAAAARDGGKEDSVTGDCESSAALRKLNYVLYATLLRMRKNLWRVQPYACDNSSSFSTSDSLNQKYIILEHWKQV